jgi:hypothetical protein
MNLLIARGAYRSAARTYPKNLIELRQGRAHRREEQIGAEAALGQILRFSTVVEKFLLRQLLLLASSRSGRTGQQALDRAWRV